MGAYENPQAVVDRQSGQIWANTIAGVTKATTDYIDFTRQKDDELAKKVQAQLDWALEYGLKKQDQVLANLNKLNADPSAFKIANGLLDNITDSALSMKKASNNAELKKAQKENAAYSKRLTQLYNIIQADNASAQFYKDEFDPSIAGLQNGMSTSRPETPDYVAAQNVNTGLAAGNKEYYYDATTGSYRVKFSGENIDGTIDKDAMLFFNYDPGKVTDINSMITGAYQTNNFLDENGRLTDKSLSRFEYTIPIKGTNYGSLHVKANTGAIATTMTPIIEAQAESFFQDPRAAQDIWAIIGKNSNKSFDDVELVKQNSPMQIEFKRAYTEYASKLIPNNKKLKDYISLADKDSDKDPGSGGKGYGKINLTPEELYNRFKNDPADSWAQYMDVPNVQYDAQTNIVIIPETEKTEAETFDLSTNQGAKRFFTLVLSKYPGIGGDTVGKRFKNDYLRLINAEMGPVQEAATKGTGRLDPILQQIQ